VNERSLDADDHEPFAAVAAAGLSSAAAADCVGIGMAEDPH